MAEKNIMVCVTQQKHCERLIHAGARMLEETHSDKLYIVHVFKSGQKVIGAKQNAEALDYLYERSKAVGAEMNVIKSDDIPGTLTDFANKHGIRRIIMGASPGTAGESRIAQDVGKRLGDVTITIL